MIQTGEQAPDFELPDHEGNPVRLSGLRGRPVVLYFYPKADTPGCTTQACGIRDHRADYDAAGAVFLYTQPAEKELGDTRAAEPSDQPPDVTSAAATAAGP